MNVLFISTTYPTDDKDWRGRFIERMLEALGRNPSLDFSVWAPPGKLPAGSSCALSEHEARYLEKLMHHGGIAHLIRRRKTLSIPYILGLLVSLALTFIKHKKYDLAHINWMQNAIPLITNRTPALVSVLGSDFALLKLPGMKSILRHVFKKRPTILAPNAEWMTRELALRFGDVAQIVCVPFGVDRKWFQIQRDLTEFQTKRKWIAVTRLTSKKIGDLFKWGEELFTKEDELHLIGPMQEQIQLPEWVHYHGPASPAQLQQEWFPNSAGLITLSHHDEGRPQVLLEAMASSLPVICSALDAHTDIIKDGIQGHIVQSKRDFQDAIKKLSDREHNITIGNNARSIIYNDIGDWGKCADRYTDLYLNLTQKNNE